MNSTFNSVSSRILDALSRGVVRFSFASAATFVLFFVLSFLALPTNSQLFAHLVPTENQLVDSDVASEYARNDDGANSTESNDKTGQEHESQWLRVRYVDGVPNAMQTSIVSFSGSYVGSDGSTRDVVVDLIGAIHMADKKYYEELNREFSTYETVVFELVAAKGADVKRTIELERANQKEQISLNPLNAISLSQQLMCKTLDMTYQIDGVDYTAPNLRRGDMDAEDFILKLLENGDVQRFFEEMFYSYFLPSESSSGVGMLVALLASKDKRLALKRTMAKELVDSAIDEIEEEAKAVDDPSNDRHENVLIHFRNKKALEVVKQELNAGRTRVAVFYGAAHLPDMAQRLEKEFGLKQNPEPRWMNAWDLQRQK